MVYQQAPLERRLLLRRLLLFSSGSSYLQGEGLKILSGEKQRALQDQVATAEATRTVLEEESRELQKRVSDHALSLSPMFDWLESVGEAVGMRLLAVVVGHHHVRYVFMLVGTVQQGSYPAAKERSRNGSSKLPSLQIKGWSNWIACCQIFLVHSCPLHQINSYLTC